MMMTSSPYICIKSSECSSPGLIFAMDENPSPPNRKRRLDHLSIEEKIKRKKLKNRVAAQTSRDRKKVRMDELEAEIKQLTVKNHKLSLANNSLKTEKEKLASENIKLRKKITNYKAIECCHHQSLDVTCRSSILGPAVPPLPKGMPVLQLAPRLENLQRSTATWWILTFWILSQISLQTSMETNRLKNLKNLQIVYFKKLWFMSKGNSRRQILRLQEYAQNNAVPLKWWGRHRKTWNPVED